MELNQLSAISPIDGRYRDKVKNLQEYFSEYALIRYRVQVEVEYLIFLSEMGLPQIQEFSEDKKVQLKSLYKQFSMEDASKIKEIESVTNHDVKAVEYFIKESIDKWDMQSVKEFVHFGLTSQDINNTAIPLSLKEAINAEWLPMLEGLITKLDELSTKWKDVPMLAKTHGQPASPTRLGKEIEVFAERLKRQKELLLAVPYSCKFGGATGNFNAHYVSFPEVDWHKAGKEFTQTRLGLERSFPTTQIEHYDNLAALFDGIKRINTILIDFSRDVWQYVSMDYFKQKIKKGEVGSSAMPHKVNPIDFENAEGNLGIANALFEHFSAKLPISRLQRDLTDSTVLRNIGIPIAHSMISLQSINKGLGKLELNQNTINQDLENNWAVVAEAIQNILRRESYPNPYEALKELTRINKKIEASDIKKFIEGLDVNEKIKEELRNISPSNYTGK